MIEEGVFEKTDLDTMPSVKEGEFSVNGISKQRKKNNELMGQINFPDGVPGLAVYSQSGYGDGQYDVYAEIVTVKVPTEHKRVKRIWIDFMEEGE